MSASQEGVTGQLQPELSLLPEAVLGLCAQQGGKVRRCSLTS